MNATTPWDRSPTNGFRCAKYPEGDPPEPLRGAIDRPPQDFSREVTMPEQVFETMKHFYAYDHARPLGASVDSSRQLEWGAVEEWVSIDAAYGGERLPMRLLLPAGGGGGPFQAVIFFPGSNLLFQHELVRHPPSFTSWCALAVWSSSRFTTGGFSATTAARCSASRPRPTSIVAHWAQDLGRVIDYLEQRPDIDATKVAFAGLSLGAGLVPNLLAHEPRVQAAILWSGGFGVTEDQRRSIAGSDWPGA